MSEMNGLVPAEVQEPGRVLESSKAQSLAEKAQLAKQSAQERAQQRQERNGERKGRWGERFSKLKNAGKEAWAKVGEVKNAVVDKSKAAAAEAGQMIVDSPVVNKVDAIQASARARGLELGANLVETADRATTGVANRIDKAGRDVDAFKAATKAEAAKRAADALTGAVNKVRAGMQEVDGLLSKIVVEGEVAEDGPKSVVDKLEAQAQEQGQKKEDAKKRGDTVKGLRGWLRRLGA